MPWEASLSSSLNQIPGCRTSPGQSAAGQTSWSRDLLIFVPLAPRPAQWTSSLQAVCSTMCFPVAATPSERVFIVRQTSLRGRPVWLTWRKRPTVRATWAGRGGGKQGRGWAGLKPPLSLSPLQTRSSPGTWWRPCSAPCRRLAPPLCRCWPTPSFGAEPSSSSSSRSVGNLERGLRKFGF